MLCRPLRTLHGHLSAVFCSVHSHANSFCLHASVELVALCGSACSNLHSGDFFLRIDALLLDLQMGVFLGSLDLLLLSFELEFLLFELEFLHLHLYHWVLHLLLRGLLRGLLLTLLSDLHRGLCGHHRNLVGDARKLDDRIAELHAVLRVRRSFALNG